MSRETAIPKRADIGKKGGSAAADLPVQALLALFQGDPELLTVAIADAGLFLGSVSRKELLNLLSRQFARDLYARKPVSTLLDELGGKKVLLMPDLDINEAAVRLLSLDPALQTDPFPRLKDGGASGWWRCPT